MNKQEIRELMRFFDKSGINKLKIKEGDFFIELQKNSEYIGRYEDEGYAQQLPVVNAQIEQASIENQKNENSAKPVNALPTFKAPMVGTFYKSPSPGAEAFVKIGSVVKKGQPIAIIEAMKIMNEIDAEFDCRIVDILVDDGQPVEFEMPLFSVERV